MAARALRWVVADAVRDSAGLSSACRLVMFVLLNEANTKTAVVAASHSPSLTKLTRSTALGRSTILGALTQLETLGWVVRDRPTVAAARSEGATTGYRLAVGIDPEPRAKPARPGRKKTPAGSAADPAVGQRLTQQGPDPDPDLGQPLTQGRSAADLEVGQRLNSGRSAADLKPDVPRPSQMKNTREAADAALGGGAIGNGESADDGLFPAPPKPVRPESPGQRRYRLAATYTSRVPLSNQPAIAQIVGKAIAAGNDDDAITRGLNLLADEGRTVTTDSLRIAINGRPRTGAYAGPYRDPADLSAYHEDL